MKTEPIKEMVLREKRNGKWIEMRRMKFRLTETESMLFRQKKQLERKLTRAKAALATLEIVWTNPGARVADLLTEKDMNLAASVLKELK